MHPYSMLLNDANILPPLLHPHPPQKRIYQVMAKILQEEPAQPSLLLPGVIYLKVSSQLLSHHPHPLNHLWMHPSSPHPGTPPMRATILQNQIPVFALHGIFKCTLLKDQWDPIKSQIGGRKKPPIMMCMAQGMSSTRMRDVIHPKMSSIFYLLLWEGKKSIAFHGVSKCISIKISPWDLPFIHILPKPMRSWLWK